MTQFKVGDQITVLAGPHPTAIRQVANVTDRQVVDNKGDAWVAKTGVEWGRGGSFALGGAKKIVLTRPGDRELLDFRLMRSQTIRVCQELQMIADKATTEADLDPFVKHIAALRDLLSKREAIAAAGRKS